MPHYGLRLLSLLVDALTSSPRHKYPWGKGNR